MIALSQKNQHGIDSLSISKGDPKIRMHGKECYCDLGVCGTVKELTLMLRT